MYDIRLLPWCEGGLCPSGVLHSIDNCVTSQKSEDFKNVRLMPHSGSEHSVQGSVILMFCVLTLSHTNYLFLPVHNGPNILSNLLDFIV
jgi:hypothetical protein